MKIVVFGPVKQPAKPADPIDFNHRLLHHVEFLLQSLAATNGC
jgi:hypothetical protein